MKISYPKPAWLKNPYFLLLALGLALFFLPIIPQDPHYEFVYGAGDWSHQGRINFQNFESESSTQLSSALHKGTWQITGTNFSPSNKTESDLIYRYKLPPHAFKGKIHLVTQILNNEGILRLCVSNDGIHWHKLVQDGKAEDSKDPSSPQEGGGRTIHDVPIPMKWFDQTLYVKLSGASSSGNESVLVEQWGVKIWSLESCSSLLSQWIKRERHEIKMEGSVKQWLKNRIRYRYRNIASQSKIIVPSEGDFLSILDGNPLTASSIPIPFTNPHTATLVLDFPQPKDIGKIKLFFSGDLHWATSYHAVDYDIQVLSGKEWIGVAQKRGHHAPVATHYLRAPLQSKQIRVSFHKAFSNYGIQLGEIYLFERHNAPLFEGLMGTLAEWGKSLPAHFLYTFLFLILLFFPGYVIANLFPQRLLDEEDKFIFSFFFGVLAIVLVSLLGLLTHLSNLFYLILPLFIISLLILIQKKWLKPLRSLDRPLLISLPLFLAFGCFYQYHRDLVYALPYIEHHLDTLTIPPLPYYGYHADNLLPWRIAKFFLHHMDPTSPETAQYLGSTPTGLFHRTHLLPFLNVPFLHVFGESHFIYQKLLTVLGGLFLLPLYVLIKKIFSPKVSQMTTYALLLNTFFFFLAMGVELYYKYFALYSVLLVLVLAEKRGVSHRPANLLAGLAGGVSFFIHPAVGLLYITSVLVYVFLKEGAIIFKLKWAAAIILSILCIAIPWKCYSYHIQLKTNSQIKEIDLYSSLVLSRGFDPIKARLQYLGEIVAPSSRTSPWYGKGGLVETVSLPLFVIFMIAIKNNFKKYRRLATLIFLPSLMVALLLGQYFPGATLHGAYLSIPLILAVCLDFLCQKKGGKSQKMLFLSLTVLFYTSYNLYRAGRLGAFFMPQIVQFTHLETPYLVTFTGTLIYIATVVFLLFKTCFSRREACVQTPA